MDLPAPLQWTEHVLFSLLLAVVVRSYVLYGLTGVLKDLVKFLRLLPGVDSLIQFILAREVQTFMNKVSATPVDNEPVKKAVKIPEKGCSAEELLQDMAELKALETVTEDGKVFAYVYTMEDDHAKTLRKAFDMFNDPTGYDGNDKPSARENVVNQFAHTFLHENALSPMVFPALRKMETEVISMVATMLNGDSRCSGSLTTGGTESILMAVKCYRDRARELMPHITQPEIVAPITIHPAFEKAAEYFNLTVCHAPLKPDFTVDLAAFEKLIGKNTVMLAASAPQYPYGIVDPIEDVGRLATKHNLPFHVDGCFGGFMLPWVEKLGYPVPPFDFRVQGVTSVSADVHKYGFGLKGSSVVVYKSSEIRRHQIFAYSSWPGGLFGSPGFSGTRPGANIAASWAALRSLGEDGYMQKAEQLMKTTLAMEEGVNSIQGLSIVGKPAMTAFAIMSTENSGIDILALADAMEARDWHMERQQLPNTLHCTIMPHHIGREMVFINDLTESADEVRGKASLSSKGTAGMYGMVAKIPDRAVVDEFILQFFDKAYKL
eukprot:scpid52964/ scgid24538/ Sphingosine-1-phosphate lyase; Sphingosine-1-phosphate aldolase